MKTLTLFLSAIISSWQFFKEAAEAPVLEISFNDENWDVLSLRSDKRTFLGFLGGIFYNPKWNEALYIMDCAERLLTDISQRNIDELMDRVVLYLKSRNLLNSSQLKYRLLYKNDVVFTSQVRELVNAS